MVLAKVVRIAVRQGQTHAKRHGSAHECLGPRRGAESVYLRSSVD